MDGILYDVVRVYGFFEVVGDVFYGGVAVCRVGGRRRG